MDQSTINSIAADLTDKFGIASLPHRFVGHHDNFGFDEAYLIALRTAALRRARNEMSVGRKIGATNRLMWPVLGAEGPFWGFMYDTTVFTWDQLDGTFDLGRFAEPRIEPEIVLRLGSAPEVGMDDVDLLRCIDAVAHGLELVHSPFVGWKFTAPDAISAYGLHMALLLGPWHAISGELGLWVDQLRDLQVSLNGSDGSALIGMGHDALGSPLLALRSLLDELAAHPSQPPLLAGEIVTTGTLTLAMPVAPGQTWNTKISGAPFEGLAVTFR